MGCLTGMQHAQPASMGPPECCAGNNKLFNPFAEEEDAQKSSNFSFYR